MWMKVLLWGTAAGVAHFVVIAVLYANPFVDRFSAEANQHPSVKQWASQPLYFATQFLGTQVEVYLMTSAFLWMRPLAPGGYPGALEVGSLIAALRVFPRFWNMWIQTTFPGRLLLVEVINGTLGVLFIACFLQAFAV